jgi:hypothetical protein
MITIFISDVVTAWWIGGGQLGNLSMASILVAILSRPRLLYAWPEERTATGTVRKLQLLYPNLFFAGNVLITWPLLYF